MIQASVVIPCHNGAAALGRLLRALASQDLPPDQFEAIVVDDGSTDGSHEVGTRVSLPYRAQVYRQPNRGPGAARNLGARHASGDCLIFLDADMIPEPAIVGQHLLAHDRFPRSLVVGRRRPSPPMAASPYERSTGHEAFHDLGIEPYRASFHVVASGNLSMGRADFDRLGGFDEALRMCEDTDLGYRAEQAGLSVVYWPEATAIHDHPKDLRQRCGQAYGSAYYTVRLFEKHPELSEQLPVYRDVQPIRWGADPPGLVLRKVGRRALGWRPARWGLERAAGLIERLRPDTRSQGYLYWKIVSGYRVSGFRRALAEGGR